MLLTCKAFMTDNQAKTVAMQALAKRNGFIKGKFLNDLDNVWRSNHRSFLYPKELMDRLLRQYVEQCSRDYHRWVRENT